MGKVVFRKLAYAWFEYLDKRDALEFDAGMRQMGFTNLFEYLSGNKKSGYIDTSHDGKTTPGGQAINRMQIKEFTQGNHPPGVLATPESDHGPFLQQWILNPGVRWNRKGLETDSRLTFTNPDVKPEIVVFSGHGAGGGVYGNACGTDANMSISKAFAPEEIITSAPGADPQTKEYRNSAIASDGTLKFLIIASCNNLNSNMIYEWMNAVTRKARPNDPAPTIPLHGVLGYSNTYPGDETGAQVMRTFVQLLRSAAETQNDMTVLEAWAEANKGLKWGAVVSESHSNDLIRLWLTSPTGLPKATQGQGCIHFDDTSYKNPNPGGKKVGLDHGGTPIKKPAKSEMPTFDARWMAKRGEINGTYFEDDGENVITATNGAETKRGFHPGKTIRLRIRTRKLPNGKTTRAGETIKLMFYYFRPGRTEMDVEKLFDLDAPDPSGETLTRFTKAQRGHDPSRPAGGSGTAVASKGVDMLEYVLTGDGVARNFFDHDTFGVAASQGQKDGYFDLVFLVRKDAHKNPDFHKDENGFATHGRFHVRIVEQEASASDPNAGSNLTAHGVYLYES